jgi:hypothetical protein
MMLLIGGGAASLSFAYDKDNKKKKKNSKSAPCVGFEKLTPMLQLNPMDNHFHSNTFFLLIATVTPFMMSEAE